MRRKYLRPDPAQTQQSGSVLSVESMTIDQILTGRKVLSVEEEVIALQEADELATQATQDVAEASRVEDITDVMLNVADTVSEVKDLTPEQAMLVDTVSEMAVAGTPDDPDQVIPSAEPLIGKDMTVESFAEDLKTAALRVWENIRKFADQIWETIKAFFARLFSAAPRNLHRIKVLTDVIAQRKKDKREKPKAAAFTIKVGVNPVSYPDYTVRNAGELIKGLDELDKLAKYTYGEYLKSGKAIGDLVANELKKFDPAKAGDALNAVAVGGVQKNFTTAPPLPVTGYLGCFGLSVVRLAKDKTKDLSDPQIVAALRHTGVRLTPRTGKAAWVGNHQFQTMTFAEMTSVMKSCESLIKQLIASETSGDTKGYDATRKAMAEGATKAAEAMGKIDKNDESGKSQRVYAMDVMKALANFHTTMGRWTTDLNVPVSKRIYQSVRAALMLVENSLALY
jgi:hypothetical protein